MHRLRISLITLWLALLPLAGHAAWWHPDWPQRSRFTLDAGASGAGLTEPVQGALLALRLHSGNFDFLAAQPDGRDLRVLAADDKTPLPFRIERFDPANELGLLWVLLPTVAPGSEQNQVHVYVGNAAATVEAGAATALDAALLARFAFGDSEGAEVRGQLKAVSALAAEANGLLAGALKLDGQAAEWPATDTVATAAGGAYTVSLWFKSDALPSGQLFTQGPVQLALQAGRLTARIGSRDIAGGEVRPGSWSHVALSLGGGRAVLYLDGAAVAEAAIDSPAIGGGFRVGAGFRGTVDELQIAAVARPAAWLKLAAATQGIGAAGLRGQLEREGEGAADDGGSHSYMGILVANLTVDAWVVIIILGLMFVVALWVMVTKTLFVTRADGDNQRFLALFRDSGAELLALEAGAGAHGHSPLFRLYQAGVRELAKRQVGQPGSAPLSGASLDAVKASIDATLVRESHRLNAQMVLLTIAISGGPFLGLLGTVVGVMITFAAIAAAGDVNVNAIAPGIAAALLATVAGLAVAIPALFGYNWLASRIKNVSADMQIFVDEFVTRVAEIYGAR